MKKAIILLLVAFSSLAVFGQVTRPQNSWTGPVIAGQYGGTGVANTGKTITVGGNFSTAAALTFSGAHAATFTLTAPTTVTFPTTGTLMSESSSDSITGIKKFYGENIYYQAIQTVTDTTALTLNGYQTVLADATASAILITLPNAALCEGKVIEIKCINADSEVKIITGGGNIDATAGATGITMVVWECKRLISNGTNWYIL